MPNDPGQQLLQEDMLFAEEVLRAMSALRRDDSADQWPSAETTGDQAFSQEAVT